MRCNPFESASARERSSFLRAQDGVLLGARDGFRASKAAELVHGQFRALVESSGFPCVGAKAALAKGTYRFGLYARLGDKPTTEGLCYDLFDFVQEQGKEDGSLPWPFTTFIASFLEPCIRSEYQFHRLLWKQLKLLREKDAEFHRWAPDVSEDPTDERFSFSFAERAFFIVGLNAASCRWSRRFAWPTVVFNARYQFDKLREEGRFETIRQRIRKRDVALQGCINPNLADFGEASEALQYSGMHWDGRKIAEAQARQRNEGIHRS